MIGDLIRKARLSKGFKQSELAAMLAVSTSAIGMYEQNRREPDIETIVKLAKCLDVTLEYLLGVGDRPTEEERHVLEVTNYFYNEEKPADEGELEKDVVIYHRDGKTVRRKFTKAQLAMISAMLDAIPDETDGNSEL